MIILFITILVGIDQIIKYYINTNLYIGQNITIMEDFLNITFIKNTGIAFGLFKSNNLFMIFVVLFLILILIYFYNREKKKNTLLKIAFIFLISGALGNLIDRIVYGSIIDYINFAFWPAFNLADSLIVMGSILLGIYLIFYTK